MQATETYLYIPRNHGPVRKIPGEEGIAGPFEELPALMVVLIAISLFSVSLAHATVSLDNDRQYAALQKDCQTFAGMVRNSDILCGGNSAGIYDMDGIRNSNNETFQKEFNSTLLGFEYKIQIQPMGNETAIIIQSSGMTDIPQVATFHTCVNILENGRISAARLIVSIWEVPQ